MTKEIGIREINISDSYVSAYKNIFVVLTTRQTVSKLRKVNCSNSNIYYFFYRYLQVQIIPSNGFTLYYFSYKNFFYKNVNSRNLQMSLILLKNKFENVFSLTFECF